MAHMELIENDSDSPTQCTIHTRIWKRYFFGKIFFNNFNKSCIQKSVYKTKAEKTFKGE